MLTSFKNLFSEHFYPFFFASLIRHRATNIRRVKEQNSDRTTRTLGQSFPGKIFFLYFFIDFLRKINPSICADQETYEACLAPES